MYAFPLIQPRIDALNDHVIGTITSNSPFMLTKRRGTTDRLKALETVLHMFAQNGGLKEALKKIGIITGNTNLGIMRCWFDVGASTFRPTDYAQGTMSDDPIQFAGFRFDVIHPRDFICYPHTEPIETATCVGHRFTARFEAIKELQEAGRYYSDVEPIQTDNDIERSGRDPNYAKVSSQPTGDTEDYTGEMYELVCKLRLGDDKFERYYIITFQHGHKRIFSVRPYDDPRPFYFDFRYLPKNYGSFYPSNAVSTNMQGLQHLYTYLNNVLIYGSIWNAFPGGYSSGLGAKSVTLEYGAIVPVSGDVQIIPNQFNPAAIMNIIMAVESVADSTCRISKAGLAMQGGGSKTATQQMAEDAGMQSGISGFIDTFGASLEAVYDYMAYVLLLTFDIWYPIYQASLPPELTPDVFIGPYEWELYNKTPSSSPAQTVQKMQLIMQLAQADQTEVLSQVMQLVSSMVPPEKFAVIQQQVQAIQSQHMNPKAVVRTILNELNIQNKDEIMNELGGQDAGLMGQVQGMPPMALPNGQIQGNPGQPSEQPPSV